MRRPIIELVYVWRETGGEIGTKKAETAWLNGISRAALDRVSAVMETVFG